MPGPISNGKHHILVVDNERVIRETLAELFRDLFVTHTAADGNAALDLMRENPVAVLVTDQRLTKQGDDFLAKAGEISRATRVLLTGYSNAQAVEQAVDRGHIYAYVVKPWDPMELRLTVTQAADHYELVKRLHREQVLLCQLLEHSPDVIYFKDEQHRFTRVNKAKADLVGAEEPEQLVGKGDWDYFYGQEAQKIEEEDTLVISGKVPVIDQLHSFTPPDGKLRWFSTTKVALDPEAGGGLVGISRDITERKLAQEEVQQITRRLVEAEKEKKDFCARVVLAVTGGKLHLVEPDEVPHLEPLAFELALEHPHNYAAARDHLRALGTGIGLSDEAIEDLILAAGEAITNAVKHAAGGLCQACVYPDRVVVRVADNGDGIHPEDLPDSIFRAGFSTQVSMGLGYTLILQLIDALWLATGPGGTILQMEKRRPSAQAEEEDLEALLARFDTD